MQRIITLLLVIVGVINFLPVAGILSTEALASAYGITEPAGDLAILLQHRALLFGILGAIIIASAFRQHLQTTAIIAGLVSMCGFIILAGISADYGTKINNIVIADIIATILLFIVIILKYRVSNNRE